MARRRKNRILWSLLLIVLGGGLIAGAVSLAAMPRDPLSSEQRAYDLYEKGDYAGALEALDRAVKQTRDEGEPGRDHLFELLTRRGEYNLAAGRPKNAKEDFGAAKTLRPSEPLAWEREGRSLIALKQFSDAALHFEQADRKSTRLNSSHSQIS